MNATLSAALGLAASLSAAFGADSHVTSEYPDFYDGNDTRGIDFVQRIEVASPRIGATVSGEVEVAFRAPGMTHALARCWHGPTPENPASSATTRSSPTLRSARTATGHSHSPPTIFRTAPQRFASRPRTTEPSRTTTSSSSTTWAASSGASAFPIPTRPARRA